MSLSATFQGKDWEASDNTLENLSAHRFLSPHRLACGTLKRECPLDLNYKREVLVLVDHQTLDELLVSLHSAL
ncbi:hypothetical protein VNO80_25624 [Phaseolus coccineus]|uniref:Uncharacterized protein n=1 Tax=Phaseolus coccineus TaxID=3886 RepID=A0AAN9LZU0_PHACN